MIRRITGPGLAAAVAVLAVGCAGVSGHPAGPAAAVVKTTAVAAAVRPPVKPLWLQSLQMTSLTTGWALYYAGNPNSTVSPVLLLARTTDGGRIWTDVTPAAARPLLATADAGQVLDSVSGERAYLAVTGATEQSNSAVNTTRVFMTGDGGRSWADSEPLRAVSVASQLAFADPEHGFLMLGGDGGPMGQDPVWVYRTSDGGARWSLAAASPGQIPTACDKNALAFATPTVGWIAGTCNAGLAKGLLVSADGGVDWSRQSLPLSSVVGVDTAGAVDGPSFVGRVGFVTVEPEPDGAALLVTRDLGQSWQRMPLPAGLQYPQITFFSATEGVLVARETQGAFGRTFFTTADGGQTWTPVRQGANLTRLGVSVDFTSPQDGFAWTNGLETDPVPPTSIYQTTDSGRVWDFFTPKLVG